jgi:hypothetical protein
METVLAPAFDVHHLGGLCPVQAEGTVNGHRFFFRARGARWRMYVAGQPGEHTDPMGKDGWLFEEPYGTWPDAGYMDQSTAQACIQRSLNAWMARAASTDPAHPTSSSSRK